MPMMTTGSRSSATFAAFFKAVVAVTTGRGLTHREIMELVRYRLGGGHAQEFDELRARGWRLQQIVDHFLMKDEANRQGTAQKVLLNTFVL